jgi:hypothetical protein
MLWYAKHETDDSGLAPSPDVPLFSQPRMYSHLTVTGRRVLSSTQNPNRLIMWQKLEYTARVTGSKKVWPVSTSRMFPEALTDQLGGRVDSSH